MARQGSPLDQAYGNWEPIVTNRFPASVAAAIQTTINDMSLAFTKVIAPLCTARATRVKAWRNWCMVLMLAAAQSSLDHILPKDAPVLQALL